MTKQPHSATKLRLSKLFRWLAVLCFIKLSMLCMLLLDVPLPSWLGGAPSQTAFVPPADPLSEAAVMDKLTALVAASRQENDKSAEPVELPEVKVTQVAKVTAPVAAVSVGIVQGTPLLDLEYVEDVDCDTDMNVVMTGAGHYVEVQGTAEGVAFTRAEMDQLLGLAEQGIAQLVQLQQQALQNTP